MKPLLNFMQTDPITKSTLFPYLKCSKEEVEILRYMCGEVLKGNDEILCIDMINFLFAPKEYEILKYLPYFKNLLELGWITQNNFLKSYY